MSLITSTVLGNKWYYRISNYIGKGLIMFVFGM